MPRKLLLTLLAATVVPIASVARADVTTTSTPDRFACATESPSRTLARSEFGRVFAVERGTEDGYLRRKVFACNARTGKVFYMGLDLVAVDQDTSPTFLRRMMAPDIVENSVAWVISVNDPETGTRSELRQISLGSGRLLRRATVGSAFVRPLQGDNGYLAWIDTALNGSCNPTCEVHLFNPRGNRVIDSGPDIEPDSLARGPGPAVGASSTIGGVPRIYWIKGGVARTALYRD